MWNQREVDVLTIARQGGRVNCTRRRSHLPTEIRQTG
jgi:hypothetical protein